MTVPALPNGCRQLTLDDLPGVRGTCPDLTVKLAVTAEQLRWRRKVQLRVLQALKHPALDPLTEVDRRDFLRRAVGGL